MTPLKLDLKAPHVTYRDSTGKRLPGVTTICGVIGKESLLGWYAAMEREGILAAMGNVAWLASALKVMLPVNEDGEPQWFAEIKRDKAADLGTVTHGRIEAWLKGTTLDPEGIDPVLYAESIHGFDRFRTSWDQDGMELIHCEHVMVSEKLRCGGTLDVLCKDKDRRLVLRDIKTSKASKYWPYPNVFAQIGGYGMIYEETSGQRVERIIIDRVGKTLGDRGEQYEVTEAKCNAGKDLFVSARSAYDAINALNRK